MEYQYVQYNKNQIKKYGDEKKLNELIDLVSECSTLKEYKKFRSKYKDNNYAGEGASNWNNSNSLCTPKEWLAIYKYADEYGNWSSKTQICGPAWKDKTVLDFGAGSGTPWSGDIDGVDLYLLEANLGISSLLKKRYESFPNVKIITTFKELPKDIKFDYIYSKNVLEHVRYLNEHLEILYYLGNENCDYWLQIDPNPMGGHVMNLHEDTKIKTQFWNDKK